MKIGPVASADLGHHYVQFIRDRLVARNPDTVVMLIHMVIFQIQSGLCEADSAIAKILQLLQLLDAFNLVNNSMVVTALSSLKAVHYRKFGRRLALGAYLQVNRPAHDFRSADQCESLIRLIMSPWMSGSSGIPEEFGDLIDRMVALADENLAFEAMMEWLSRVGMSIEAVSQAVQPADPGRPLSPWPTRKRGSVGDQ